MIHIRPELNYAEHALEPFISAETLQYHSGKHHQTYVDNLNRLIVGTPHENQTLEEIIRSSQGAIFNNAAQVWNHTFYFENLAPAGTTEPSSGLSHSLNQQWGSIDWFKKEFDSVALSTFWSGWVWLVREPNGKLAIVSTSNAATPLTSENTPIFTCDVWEHAYYIDTRNARAKYLENFWNVVNWTMASKRFESA